MIRSFLSTCPLMIRAYLNGPGQYWKGLHIIWWTVLMELGIGNQVLSVMWYEDTFTAGNHRGTVQQITTLWSGIDRIDSQCNTFKAQACPKTYFRHQFKVFSHCKEHFRDQFKVVCHCDMDIIVHLYSVTFPPAILLAWLIQCVDQGFHLHFGLFGCQGLTLQHMGC